MRRLFLFMAAAAFGALLMPQHPAFAAPPRPGDVFIRNVRVGGPGCPQGTTSVLVTSTVPGGPADLFEVIYDNFEVSQGPHIALAEARKFCNIVVDLYFPQGYRFTLTQVHFEGYADLARGATGKLETEYFFPFFSNRVSTSKVIRGPYKKDYERNDTLGLFSRIWSPCGLTVPLNAKTTMTVDGPRSDESRMTVDLTTGKLYQIWAIQWESCR